MDITCSPLSKGQQKGWPGHSLSTENRNFPLKCFHSHDVSAGVHCNHGEAVLGVKVLDDVHFPLAKKEATSRSRPHDESELNPFH